MSLFSAVFGDESRKFIKKLQPIVEKVSALEPEFEKLPAEALKEKTVQFKDRLRRGETLDDLLPEAFAAVREASKRTLGQRHFDVQLIGGAALHFGKIAEMKTGEGKTLVATLPAYLNALVGEGVHIVTVNDYLSRRDAVWMGQIYHLLGLSVGVINHDSSFLYDPAHSGGQTQNSKLKAERSDSETGSEKGGNDLDRERDLTGSFKVVYEFLRPCTRREAYTADVTYGTNNEFGFDYLRDNLEYDIKNVRQRLSAPPAGSVRQAGDFHYAIVDEIDSILIDEARTPLIISAATVESERLYERFAAIVRNFEEGLDYEVDEKFRAVTLTPEGIAKAERALGIENIYTDRGIKYVHHLETAVKAKALYRRDKEYVVRSSADGAEVVIVDEFTGRLQPGRRWSEGLHQAIEAKEGVPIQKETRTFASITFQNYFRLYRKLSGMTGTALTSKEEFFKVYGLDVVSVPTNRPMIRADRNDLIFQTEKGKFQAIVRKVKELHDRGQPVLVGTVSIERNEKLSEQFRRAGIPHEVLNAKNHEREGEIIAQAGRKGAVTIATNMAGRGVDIKLGGNPALPEAYREVKNLGGLFVLGTERHEARRIDNQLRGRSGRQGDPGESQFFVSLEDNLMRIFAKDIVKKMMGRLGVPEDEPIENRLITKSLEAAQTKIEGFHFDARKHVLEYDDVLNYQRKIVYERRRKLLAGSTEDIKEYLSGLIRGDETLNKGVNEKIAAIGERPFYELVRRMALQTSDLFWVDHLEMMDYLRSSVNLRAYGQRDPLVEYKREGLRLFKEMEASIADQILRLVPHIAAPAAPTAVGELGSVYHGALETGGSAVKTAAGAGRHSSKGEVGRNDPCPCGSGKKYKKCHGR